MCSSNHRGMEWPGGLVCGRVVEQCGNTTMSVAPSATDTMTCFLVEMFSCCSVAGDSNEIARALVHSSEESIKSAHAAISRPRRRYFWLNAQAVPSLAGVWNVRCIRMTDSAELMICSIRPVNRRKRLESRLPFRDFVGNMTWRIVR